jgi:hypothetical protein
MSVELVRASRLNGGAFYVRLAHSSWKNNNRLARIERDRWAEVERISVEGLN